MQATDRQTLRQPPADAAPQPLVWLDGRAAGRVLGVSPRRVRQLATRHGWRTLRQRGRGGDRLTFAQPDILDHLAEQQASEPPAPAAQPAGELCAAQARRMQIISAVVAAAEGAQTAIIKEKAAQRGIHERTIRRWLAEYKAQGADALDDGRKGNRNAAKVDDFVRNTIYSIRRSKQSPTVQQVCDGYLDRRRTHPEENLPELSYAAVLYTLGSIPEPILKHDRGGNPRRAIEKYNIAHIERDWTTIPVMHTWMGDATVWDQLLRHPDYIKPIRGVVEFVIDIRSRFAVGHRMVERLDGGTVMLTLRAAWLRYGLCKLFYYDNGSEVVNKDALGKTISKGKVEVGGWEGYFEAMGVHLIRARALHPEGKAPIERLFATLSHSYLNLFTGHTGGNLGNKTKPKDADRLKAEVKGGALMTWDQGQDLLDRIVRAYNARPHSALGGKSPAEVFDKLYGLSAEGLPEKPVQVGRRALDFAMRRKDEKTIGADGIKLMNVTYRPRQTQEYREDRRAYLFATGRKGFVAHDPADMRVVHLYQLVNRKPEFVCELVPYSKVDVRDAQQLRRLMAEQKADQRTVTKASKILLRREIDADMHLQQGALNKNAEVMSAHDERFPVDGKPAAAGETEKADVLRFPAGGAPKRPETKPPTEPYADDEDVEVAAKLAAYGGRFGEKK